MTALQFFTSPFAVAGLAATATLTGSLGSQLITARANLKSKRLELSYARKADAYRDLLTEMRHFFVKSTTYVDDKSLLDGPEREELYRNYQKALTQAELVASNELYRALTRGDGLLMFVQSMRKMNNETTHEQRTAIMGHDLLKCQEEIQSLMRADLNRLGGL